MGKRKSTAGNRRKTVTVRERMAVGARFDPGSARSAEATGCKRIADLASTWQCEDGYVRDTSFPSQMEIASIWTSADNWSSDRSRQTARRRHLRPARP